MENPEIYFPELSPIENNYLEQNYSVDDGEPLLLITLDLGDGRSDLIKAYQHDDSEQLALDFCHKHKLGARAKLLLSDEIEKYLKIALSRAAALPSPNSSPQSSRPNRKQNFTQKSMQSKQLTPVTNSKNRYSLQPNHKSPNRALRTQNTSVLYTQKSPLKRNSKRANSMIEKPDSYEFKSISGSPCQDSSPCKPEAKNEKSERIMKKIKYQRYKEIFQSLSPDTKGVITSETVTKNNLSPQISKIINPLLEELQEMNETLDFNEFYDAMEMLMRVLTPGDKSSLLLSERFKSNRPEKFEFKPKTNTGKSNLANMSCSSLYDRGVQKKMEISRRIEKERESVIEEEMKECKFVPSITRHRRSLSSISFKG